MVAVSLRFQSGEPTIRRPYRCRFAVGTQNRFRESNGGILLLLGQSEAVVIVPEIKVESVEMGNSRMNDG